MGDGAERNDSYDSFYRLQKTCAEHPLKSENFQLTWTSVEKGNRSVTGNTREGLLVIPALCLTFPRKINKKARPFLRHSSLFQFSESQFYGCKLRLLVSFIVALYKATHI